MFVTHLPPAHLAYRQTEEHSEGQDEQSLSFIYRPIKLDEALGECRPPWLRQIIAPTLPSVSVNQVCSS